MFVDGYTAPTHVNSSHVASEIAYLSCQNTQKVLKEKFNILETTLIKLIESLALNINSQAQNSQFVNLMLGSLHGTNK